MPTNKNIAQIIDASVEGIYATGNWSMESLWRLLFESAQGALRLFVLSLLSKSILSQKFLGTDAWWTDYAVYAVAKYDCFAVVLSNCALWAVLLPRALYRFTHTFRIFAEGTCNA
ncbi:MAG: hypothetical protein F6K11_23640 [Leptolyngbya sp. SIO3F4]|nr:hypothetical protein [Leptolyngbya sp. SIO3F4]